MTDKSLRPATRDEPCQTLGYALQRTRTGTPHRHAADFMAQIGAEILADHLLRSGFVILKRPPIGDAIPRPASHPLKE